MFENLKNYFEENPTLLYVSVIVMIACIIIGVVVIFAYKAVRKKRAAKELEQKAIEEFNSSPSAALPYEDFVEPSKEESSASDENVAPADKSDEKDEESVSIAADDQAADKAEPETSTTVEQFAKEQADKIKESGAETEQIKVKPVKLENVDQAPDESASASTEPKKAAPKAARSRYTGKWIISEEDGRYTATLMASNGEVLLRSESYSALSGVKSGIDTINKNIMKNNFALSIDKNGKYFFKLYSSSTRLLCISEVYGTKALCESAMESTKRFSQTAVVIVEKKEQ